MTKLYKRISRDYRGNEDPYMYVPFEPNREAAYIYANVAYWSDRSGIKAWVDGLIDAVLWSEEVLDEDNS